ncbi:MAG: hypothetical protein COB67_09115, partial [SAR324 cluster bacterium]
MELNRYYTISEAGNEAKHFSQSLLQSYPITRACLSILGSKLIDQLEFGFFTGGRNIIHQGETGKELFLLCNNLIDVLVNEQVVVQMEAPALLGDKAIVEPKSTRSATIRVADKNVCLILKIPMGLFLRNFRDPKIPDRSFHQESGIFYSMFEGIQKRLFEYIYLQKNLWEEVTTTLGLLNTQLIAKNLENARDQGWGPEIWNSVKQVLAKEFRFNWPEQIELNSQTLREILLRVLANKFPRAKFPGNDSDYVIQKNLMWHQWLSTVGQAVTKVLPKEKQP